MEVTILKQFIKNLQKAPKIFSSKSLSFQLFCLEISLILLVGITILFVYIRTTHQIYDQNYKYVNDIIFQMENNMNTHLTSINNIAFNVAFNDDVKKLLDSTEPVQRYEVSSSVREFLTKLKSLNNDIQEIGLIGIDGFEYNLGYDRKKNEQIHEMIQKIGKGSKAQYLGIIENTTTNNKEIVFANNIYSEERTLNHMGYVITLVNVSAFAKELSRELGEYYIVDEKDNIIISADENNVGQSVTTYGEGVTKKHSWKVNMPLHIVGINTKKQITADIEKTRSAYIIIISIMIFMILLTYIFFSRYTVKPLNKVSKFISTISNGDLRLLKKRMTVEGPKEIRLIRREINELLDEVNNLTHRLVSTTSRLYNIELAKKKAELDYLKSQVNPHFLYNTLGIIKGIAVVKGEEEIKEIASALVKIFRYSIKGEDSVAFSQELDIAKAYIRIQEIRFHNRFQVEYNIESHLMDIKVQKMILQPIIENAIFHGIEPISRKCNIDIRASEDGEGVKICIIDDGVGIEEERLIALREELATQGEEIGENEHIGLNNVHARLRHIYGENAGLAIHSEKGKGTTVCLSIPSDMIDEVGMDDI